MWLNLSRVIAGGRCGVGVVGLCGVGGGFGLGCCSLLENYTVDASIFVAKLLRAHGGCLGIRSR